MEQGICFYGKMDFGVKIILVCLSVILPSGRLLLYSDNNLIVENLMYTLYNYINNRAINQEEKFK